jgi:hypothetical protein
MTPRRLILHTAVSSAISMHSFFNVSGRATPHFYVNAQGEGEQYIDTGHRSTANLNGNHDCITVESWDGYPWGNGQVPGWTDAQVDWLARLAVWVHEKHGIPVRKLPSSRPGTTGIGWHRQGIDGDFPASGLLAGRVAGGELWSGDRGKVCPGDNKIRGVVDRIIPRAKHLLSGDEMNAEDWNRLANMLDSRISPLAARIEQIREALSDFRENERGRDAEERARHARLRAAVEHLPDREPLTKRQVREVVDRALKAHLD